MFDVNLRDTLNLIKMPGYGTQKKNNNVTKWVPFDTGKSKGTALVKYFVLVTIVYQMS